MGLLVDRFDLNAMGCDGKGNFYCFKANTKPTAPALALFLGGLAGFGLMSQRKAV